MNILSFGSITCFKIKMYDLEISVNTVDYTVLRKHPPFAHRDNIPTLYRSTANASRNVKYRTGGDGRASTILQAEIPCPPGCSHIGIFNIAVLTAYTISHARASTFEVVLRHLSHFSTSLATSRPWRIRRRPLWCPPRELVSNGRAEEMKERAGRFSRWIGVKCVYVCVRAEVGECIVVR